MQQPVRELHLHSDPDAVAAWCRDRLEAGSAYVAPSAAARRRVLDALARHRVALGATVTSRGRLLSLLEQRAGVGCPRLVPHALERLLVVDCAREARVPLFDGATAPPSGAVDAVARLLRTLRLNGITPDAFRDAGGDARAAEAYRRYESRRATLGLADEAARIARLLDAGVPAMSLTFEELVLPHAMALRLFTAVAARARRCRVGAVDLADASSPCRLEQQLAPLGFTVSRQAGELPAAHVTTIGASGSYDEVELVARRILALLRAGDVRSADVLAITPGARYLTLLHDALAALGVPVASPRRVAVLDVPLVATLLACFRAIADPDEDDAERGLALLSTVHVGLSAHRYPRLARTLVRRGQGAVRSWASIAADEVSPAFRELASAVPSLAASLDGAHHPHDFAVVLSKLALDHRFLSAGRRANLAAGRDDLVRLDQQGWDALVAAMEELDEALRLAGVRRLHAGEWLAALVDALAAVQVKAEPKATDGVHVVVAGAGLPSAAHVFALGWREGLVPRRVREDPLLPDAVKKKLNECGALFPLTPDRAEEDRERKERVLRAARSTLVISYPATGNDGEAMLPSRYLDELALAGRELRSIGDVTWPLEVAATRVERLTRATVLAKHRPADSLGDEAEPVRRTLDMLSRDELDAWRGRRNAGAAVVLGAAERAELAALAEQMSASQSKMLAHCVYEHFGKQRLGLEALTAPALDALTLGSVAHRILARVGRAGFEPALLNGIFDEEWNAATAGGLDADASAPFQRELLLEQLEALVAAERSAIREARPRHFELAFGLADEEGRDPASRAEGVRLPLPAEAPIAATILRGSIDRVDVLERDGRRYGLAVDYKSGKGDSYFRDAEQLADFQLPIYCTALPTFGVEPVGAVYLGIAGGERHGVMRADLAEAFGIGRSRTLRLLDAAEFAEYMQQRRDALAALVADLARGDVTIRPRRDDCGYCDLRPVCRIGTFGVGVTSADD